MKLESQAQRWRLILDYVYAVRDCMEGKTDEEQLKLAAESTARSKYKEVEPYRAMSKNRIIWAWRTIIDQPDEWVWGILMQYGVQPHPAYMLGWSRCSCMTCIFNSSNTWASLKQILYSRIQKITALEAKISHTLYNGKTIEDKANEGTSFIDPANEYWIQQALGEFTAPIIPSTWRMPQGARSTETSGAL